MLAWTVFHGASVPRVCTSRFSATLCRVPACHRHWPPQDVLYEAASERRSTFGSTIGNCSNSGMRNYPCSSMFLDLFMCQVYCHQLRERLSLAQDLSTTSLHCNNMRVYVPRHRHSLWNCKILGPRCRAPYIMCFPIAVSVKCLAPPVCDGLFRHPAAHCKAQ